MNSDLELENFAKTVFQKCEIAFGQNSSNAERQQASLFLQSIGENDARFLLIIEKVFISAKSPEILILFSNLGLKTIKKFWGSLEADFLLNFRSFTIAFLKDSNITQKSVINCVARLPCTITKLGWLEDNRFKSITGEVASFLSETPEKCNKGLIFLAVLIDEINIKSDLTITHQRKIASDFRDNELFNVFVLSIEVLKRILHDNKFNFSDSNDINYSFICNGLDLTNKCLNFDFIGTFIDESISDFGTLQVPSKWTEPFKPSLSNNNEEHIINLAFRIMSAIINSNNNMSNSNCVSNSLSKCLQLINSLALVRKSLFSDEKLKIKYFSLIWDVTMNILHHCPGILNDLEVFNSFCRLLISIKNNCQVSFLINLPNYESWIDTIAKFTAKAFNLHDTSSSGIHYLLQFWSKFSISISIFRGKTPKFLKTFIPEITLEFLQSNLNRISKNLCEDDDLESIMSEMEVASISEFLPHLFLFECEKSSNWVQTKLEERLKQLLLVRKENITDNNANKRLKVIEVEVAWIVYVISTVISRTLPIGMNSEKFQSYDSTLSAMVFQIIPYSTFRSELQANYGISATPLLERALLNFLSSFQKSYIHLNIIKFESSLAKNEPIMFKKIGDALNKKIDSNELMEITINKLLLNLCLWYKNNKVVSDSLEMLKMIVSGYESFKIVSKSNIVRTVLNSNFKQFGTFLNYAGNQKFRSDFYFVFSKLVFSEYEEHDSAFFLKPFDEVFTLVSNHSDVGNQEVMQKVIGLCRDLRGVFRSAVKKSNYEELFEWFYNNHFSSFLLLFEVLSSSPEASIPMLRFLEEITHNRSNRIMYSPSSTEGLQLFRSTQKALSTYCTKLRSIRIDNSNSSNDLYKNKIKGIRLTLCIMTRLLNGGYVPFGAFEFYRDNSLKEIINSIISLTFSIPLQTIYSFVKLAEVYYELIESLSRFHVGLLVDLPDEVFFQILSSINDGVQSTQVTHSVFAANSLDNICAYIISYRSKSKKPDAYEKLVMKLTPCMDMILKLISVLFQLILFDNVANQHTLTRLLNSLLVFNPRMLEYYAKVLVEAQPNEQRMALSHFFEKIIEEVRSVKFNKGSRERFSRWIISLKTHVTNVSCIPVF